MKIIQITDTHLRAPGVIVHGLDPAEQLRRTIKDVVARHSDADLVVFTGDLCDHGEPEAYALLREILAPLQSPVRLLLGNHDARPAFVEAFPEQPRDANGFVQSYIDIDQGRLLFLDSNEAGHSGGVYCEKRLGWLRDSLEGAGPAYVFIHHPPVADGMAHFEQIGLHDAAAVCEVLKDHAPGVRQIVFGHIHVALNGVSAEGFPFSSGQASSHRFIVDLDSKTPMWTSGLPCYRILTIDETGFRAYTAFAEEEVCATSYFPEGP